jgi:hypothetical protein
MTWYTGKVREPLLPGEKVTLKGQEFTIPAFNIRRSREAAKARDAMGDAAPESERGITGLVGIAAVAMSANYPEMTADLIEQELNVAELTEILKAHAAAEKAAKV